MKRLFAAKRAGHAGTLDPLASGCLPIALGEATKTVPFIMDSRKSYRFTVRWGEERDTDDAEGRVVETSAARPTPDAIAALLPASPARSSRSRRAIRRSRSRASAPMTSPATARWSSCKAGRIEIGRSTWSKAPIPTIPCSRPNAAKAPMSGPWPAIWAALLGCFGHVSALAPDLRSGPFGEVAMIPLEQLAALCDRAAAGEGSLADALCPLRPRWTTSRRWPSAGQMRQGSREAKPFSCADGTLPFPRHGLRHGLGRACRPCRSGPWRNRPQARVQPRRPAWQRRHRKGH